METKDMASNRDGYFDRGDKKMNAVADVSMARRHCRFLEEAEARRSPWKRPREVRESVAARLSAAPGTLENIARQRLKAVPNWLMARIRAVLIAELKSQMRMLEHEINICMASGRSPF